MSKFSGKYVQLLDTDTWIECRLIGIKAYGKLTGYILQPLDEFPESDEDSE